MNGDSTRVARIELPDGTPVWARISGAEELAYAEELSYTDTGFHDRVEASVESLHSLITGVARSLSGPLSAVRPDEVSVEFGIELTAKAGKVVGLLADGEAKAALTVTLTWSGGPSEPGPVPGAAPGGGGPEAGPLPGGPAPGPPRAGSGPASGIPAPGPRTGPGGAPDAGLVRSGAVTGVRAADPMRAPEPGIPAPGRHAGPGHVPAAAPAPGPEPSSRSAPDGPTAGAHPESGPRTPPPQAPPPPAPEPSPTPRPEALLGVWGHPG